MKHSRQHDDGLDAEIAERLLRGGGSTEEEGGIADLARLLSRASERQAGRPEDERVALAVFRKRRDERRGHRARLANVTIGGFAAVFTLGGVAIAAETGALPPSFGLGTSVPTPEHSAVPGAGTRASGHHGRHQAHQAASRNTAVQGASAGPTRDTRPPVPSASPTGRPTAVGEPGVHALHVKADPHGQVEGHGGVPQVLPSLAVPGHVSKGSDGKWEVVGQKDAAGASPVQGAGSDGGHGRSATSGPGSPTDLPG